METLEINKDNYKPLANHITIDGSIKYFKDEAARIDIQSISNELNEFKDKVNAGNTYIYDEEVSVMNTGDHIKIRGETYDVFIATGLLNNWDSFNIPDYDIKGLMNSKVTVIETINENNIEFDIENSFAYNVNNSQVIPNTMVIDVTILSPKLYTIKFYGNPISD